MHLQIQSKSSFLVILLWTFLCRTTHAQQIQENVASNSTRPSSANSSISLINVSISKDIQGTRFLGNDYNGTVRNSSLGFNQSVPIGPMATQTVPISLENTVVPTLPSNFNNKTFTGPAIIPPVSTPISNLTESSAAFSKKESPSNNTNSTFLNAVTSNIMSSATSTRPPSNETVNIPIRNSTLPATPSLNQTVSSPSIRPPSNETVNIPIRNSTLPVTPSLNTTILPPIGLPGNGTFPPSHGKNDPFPPSHGKNDSFPPFNGKNDPFPPFNGKNDPFPPFNAKNDPFAGSISGNPSRNISSTKTLPSFPRLPTPIPLNTTLFNLNPYFRPNTTTPELYASLSRLFAGNR
ncbi:hypothetical protein HMI54_000640 [Coelomomyces lativittatus]|nr:hypothetical protein HMI55_002809 [Coelomomyces lativittatus]KAJ1511639.1 hypothetical protein HMI54_000640 [Coelomomyces lativittatus]